MSTTFNIIPTKVDEGLTFKNVLEQARQTLAQQLQNLSINVKIELSVEIHENDESYVNNINGDSKFVWAENEYAWFTVNKSTGGTDAYCSKLEDNLLDCDTYLEDTLDSIVLTPQLKQKIIACEYEWYFRRSAGQPPLINLAYGHLAAAVAKISNGYIYTYDGAWHADIFPATADQLLEIYFYPEKAKDAVDYDWATRCIEGLKAEFA